MIEKDKLYPNEHSVPGTTKRTFDTGATRDADTDKYDYEGFLSPIVLKRFGQYMHKNRKMRDGSLRDSDNWQKGIPIAQYMKSMWRHFVDLWMVHRGWYEGDMPTSDFIEEALCALMFNVMGYLHEHLKAKSKRNPLPPAHSPIQGLSDAEFKRGLADKDIMPLDMGEPKYK